MQKIQSAPDRRWAKDVAPGDEIRALYLIGSASQLQAKNGPFWRLELKDASGDLEARIWSPLSQQFAEIPSGVIAGWSRAESFTRQIAGECQRAARALPEETASVDTSFSWPPATARRRVSTSSSPLPQDSRRTSRGASSSCRPGTRPSASRCSPPPPPRAYTGMGRRTA
ncbi:MAG: hypothetical protein ACLR0N_03245 [Bilophila wadsworthia]